MANILITFYKDGHSEFHYVIGDDTIIEMERKFYSDPEVKKVISANTNNLPPSQYLSAIYFDVNENINYHREQAVQIKLSEIRQKRNDLLKKLDVPYQIAWQRKNNEEMDKIGGQMELLRNLPQTVNLERFDKSIDIINYDPFKELNIK